MFFVVCEYLILKGSHGIIKSPENFNFCQREQAIVGFWLGINSIFPLESTLEAITVFPGLTNITHIHSFFGLMEQVTLTFSNPMTCLLSWSGVKGPSGWVESRWGGAGSALPATNQTDLW